MTRGFIQKLGGRKWVFVCMCFIAGVCIELFTARGVSAPFAGLLMSLAAAFGISNAAVHNAYASRPEPGNATPPEPTAEAPDDPVLWGDEDE